MPKRSPGCFECRKRKVRCDETRPECTACIRRGTECPGYRPSQSFLLYKSDEDRDQFGLMKEYEDRYMSANQEEYFTLAEATSDCIRRFDDLCGLLQHDTDSQERCLLRHEEVDDQSGRFKIWAGNIGAFQSLPSPGSLEYRLRDAPKIASQLRDLLHDLLNALSNVIDIARGSRPNRRYDPDEDDSEESGSDQGLITWSNKEREPNHHEDPDLHDVPFCRSEAEELFDSLKETIASLFRYSMLIRKASPRDRFEKALSSRDSPFDPSPDIGHVGEKYTHLAQEKKIWLRIRLGKANTQRRQYLRYARDHRTKLSKPATRIQAPVILHASKPMAVPVFALNDPTVAKSEVPSRSTLAPTAASTLLAPEVGLAEENLRDDLSQTSYATSVKEEVNEANLRLPRLTDVNKGKGAFECPLCWTIVDIRKEKAWRKHAFADLRPYVCTFEACNLQLFSTRQDWFNHELEHHRAVWVCHFCKEKSNSPETAKDHLRLQHFQQNVTDDQLNALCDASKRPVKEIAASECPFCTEWESKLRQANPDIAPDEAIVVTPFQYRSHLGSHMQQLALFALPRGYLEDDADALSVASAVAAMGIDRKASNAGSKAGSDISAHSNERAPSLTASEHERIQTFNGAEFAKTLRAKSMPTSEKATDVLVDILPRLLAEEVDELFAHIQINELFEIAYAPWQQPRVLEWLKALCHGRYGSDAFFLTNGILWRWRPSGIFPDLLCQVLSGRTSSERGHIQREFLRLNNGRSLIEMVESQSNVWFAQMLGYIAFNNHVSDPSIIVALEDIKQAIDESRSDNQLPKDGLIVGNALQRTPTGTRRILGTCRPSDLMIRSADLGRVVYMLDLLSPSLNEATRAAFILRSNIEAIRDNTNENEAFIINMLACQLIRHHWSRRGMKRLQVEYTRLFQETVLSSIDSLQSVKPEEKAFFSALLGDYDELTSHEESLNRQRAGSGSSSPAEDEVTEQERATTQASSIRLEGTDQGKPDMGNHDGVLTAEGASQATENLGSEMFSYFADISTFQARLREWETEIYPQILADLAIISSQLPGATSGTVLADFCLLQDQQRPLILRDFVWIRCENEACKELIEPDVITFDYLRTFSDGRIQFSLEAPPATAIPPRKWAIVSRRGDGAIVFDETVVLSPPFTEDDLEFNLASSGLGTGLAFAKDLHDAFLTDAFLAEVKADVGRFHEARLQVLREEEMERMIAEMEAQEREWQERDRAYEARKAKELEAQKAREPEEKAREDERLRRQERAAEELEEKRAQLGPDEESIALFRSLKKNIYFGPQDSANKSGASPPLAEGFELTEPAAMEDHGVIDYFAGRTETRPDPQTALAIFEEVMISLESYSRIPAIPDLLQQCRPSEVNAICREHHKNNGLYVAAKLGDISVAHELLLKYQASLTQDLDQERPSDPSANIWRREYTDTKHLDIEELAYLLVCLGRCLDIHATLYGPTELPDKAHCIQAAASKTYYAWMGDRCVELVHQIAEPRHLMVQKAIGRIRSESSSGTKTMGETAFWISITSLQPEFAYFLVKHRLSELRKENAFRKASVDLWAALAPGDNSKVDLEKVRAILNRFISQDTLEQFLEAEICGILDSAAQAGDLELVKLLMGSTRPDSGNAKLGINAALISATQEGHLKVVSYLLTSGANVNFTTGHGKTALAAAARNGDVTVVKLLLENGSDPNFTNTFTTTALMAAADEGHSDVARLLLDKDADPNICDRAGGWTALMYAGRSGCIDIVKELLAKGADVNATTADGWTALMYAASEGVLGTVKELIASGANVNTVSKDGHHTPLTISIGSGNVEMQQYLLECGAKPSDYLDSVDAPLNQNLTTSLPDPELANSLPYRQTKARFYGRTTEMQQLRRALDPNDQHQTLRVMAIHGLGGVGKTQLALNYAHQSKNLYDAIAWIGADTNMRLVQSLAAFAFKLGLTKEGESEADIRCIQMVKDWLDNSGKSFLLIFDNVDNVDILSQIWSIWPTSSKGAVIITTRSPKVAASLTKTTMQLKPFEVDTAVDILYELTGFEPVDYEDTKAAKEICQQIGGLPLAMVQMSTFMRDRRCTYSDFLALYKKHPEKILARNRSQVDYDHTLNNVWDMSLQSLSKNARSLLELLSLFDPDSIPERLFVTFRGALVDARLAVLTDDFEFDSAISELSAESLIKRLASSESLSLHRLVKSTVLMRIPGDERTFYFDTTIWVLSHAFSNTWDSRGSEQSHGWQHWETCSAIVAHVSSLMTLQQQHNMTASNMDEFAKLIFRIGTYLWECEQPTAAKSFFDYGLSLDIDPNSRISAQAYRILGHIGLDLAQPRAALTAYHKALEVRKQIEEPNSPAIAEVYDSIACSYCEINDAPKALEYLAKSDEINFAHHGKTTGRTQAIYSLAYLRGGPPEKALESLLLCWKLQDKTQEEIAESKYPKHAGDIVLLARIKYAFGEKQEAKRLASRTISIRRGLYGTKGPRVADSTFLVALMLKAEGEYIGAAKMFEEIVNMSKDMVEMKGHLARALWLLAATEESMRNTAEAARLRAEANKERASIVGREAPDDDTEDAYMDLVPWMLW